MGCRVPWPKSWSTSGVRWVESMTDGDSIITAPLGLVGCCCFDHYVSINSLTMGNWKENFRWVILKLISVVNGWGISCETVLIWIPLEHAFDKSTLVQVMAWCRQATHHYVSQCWPRSLKPYGVTRPQWVNIVLPDKTCIFLKVISAINAFLWNNCKYHTGTEKIEYMYHRKIC